MSFWVCGGSEKMKISNGPQPQPICLLLAMARVGRGALSCLLVWGTLFSVLGFSFTFWGFGCVPFSP